MRPKFSVAWQDIGKTTFVFPPERNKKKKKRQKTAIISSCYDCQRRSEVKVIHRIKRVQFVSATFILFSVRFWIRHSFTKRLNLQKLPTYCHHTTIHVFEYHITTVNVLRDTAQQIMSCVSYINVPTVAAQQLMS